MGEQSVGMKLVVFCLRWPVQLPTSTMHVKLKQMGVGHVVFETNNQNLMVAMNSAEYDFSPLGVLFADMRFVLRTRFIDASVVFAPRGCNKPVS